MRTIKFKLLGVLATMLLGATVSYGQSVYYSESEGGVVIDCTMMPEGTVLALDDSQEIESDDWQLPFHNEKDNANKVYPKLVVAVEDLNNGSPMDWGDAVSAAENSVLSSKSDWRLPNQRELMLIWVLRNNIETAGSDPFPSSSYWSSTVISINSPYHWDVYFGTVNPNFNADGYDTCARAVREIKLP